MEMMSPSLRTTAADGMPWTICSLTDAQMEPGNPPYPLNAGTPPSRRMSVSANSSKLERRHARLHALAHLAQHFGRDAARFLHGLDLGRGLLDDHAPCTFLVPARCFAEQYSIRYRSSNKENESLTQRRGQGRAARGRAESVEAANARMGAESSAAAESMGSGRREQNARHALVRTGTGGARAGRRARGAAAQRARKSEAPRPCAPARRRPAEAGLTAGSGWDCQDAVPRHRLRRRRGRSSGSARRSGTLP